jgi:hypothetical protein
MNSTSTDVTQVNNFHQFRIDQAKNRLYRRLKQKEKAKFINSNNKLIKKLFKMS